MDLNADAIPICQLSLWIKTAARGKRLTSLDHTIGEGNSTWTCGIQERIQRVRNRN